MKSRIILFISGLSCSVLFLMNIDLCKQLFLDGFSICAGGLVPSMLPLIIASNIILASINDLPANVKVYIVYVLGLIFGFPIGVKFASEMLASREINSIAYKKLVCCGGVPSIGFVIGVCGKHFGIEKGLVLYVITILSAFFCSLIFGSNETFKKDNTEQREIKKCSFFVVISESVKDGIMRIINICGYVIFFYAFSGIICREITNPYAVAIISGFLEFSTGCTHAVSLGNDISYVLCAAILSFSGISVFMQCTNIEKVYGAKILKSEYLLSRALQAALSSIIAYCVLLGDKIIIPILVLLTVIHFLTPFLQRVHKNKLNQPGKRSIISNQKT